MNPHALAAIGQERSVVGEKCGSSTSALTDALKTGKRSARNQWRVRVEQPVRPHHPRPADRLSGQVPTPPRQQLQRAAPETIERRTLG